MLGSRNPIPTNLPYSKKANRHQYKWPAVAFVSPGTSARSNASAIHFYNTGHLFTDLKSRCSMSH